MNEHQTLSVIIPVYNAAPWLATCLDSLLAQTRPVDEILLIDDASTDESPAILANYARNFPQMRIIQGSGTGASVARNLGIEQASGTWLAFVDADDWLESEMYQCLLDMAVSHNLDMALCNGRYHFEGRTLDYPIYTDPPLPGPVTGGEWLRHKLENQSLLHMSCIHLYRRSFIEAHHLRFVPGLMHEDVIWTTRALVLAKQVAYDDKPLYVYRKQLRHFTPSDLNSRLLKVIASAKTDARLLSELADEVGDPFLARGIRWQLVDGGLSVFHKIKQLPLSTERTRQLALARREGYFSLLWHNATNLIQKRKILNRYLRCLIAGLASYFKMLRLKLRSSSD